MKCDVCFFYEVHNFHRISTQQFKFSLKFALFSFDFKSNGTQIASNNNGTIIGLHFLLSKAYSRNQ